MTNPKTPLAGQDDNLTDEQREAQRKANENKGDKSNAGKSGR